MHAIWKGSISFGLVNIPINLYSGAEEGRVNLRLLHKKDFSPIQYLKICKAEGKEIPYEEIVKGFEYQKNQFVVLTQSDFEKVNARTTHLIDIVEFVNENEIDIRLYEKPYYLEPAKGADKAYGLLCEALMQSKKVGVATCVLHNREHLTIIKPIEGVLVLNMLRYPGEVKDISDVKIANNNQFRKQEVATAIALIKQLTKRFKPEKFHDTYVEELNAVIAAKAAGKTPKVHGKKPTATKTKNLMYVLQQSLKKARTKKETRNTQRKTRTRKAA